MVDIHCVSQKQREYVEKLQAEIDALQQKLGYGVAGRSERLVIDASHLPETT